MEFLSLITIGDGRFPNVEKFIEALEKENNRLTTWARQIFEQDFQLSTKKIEFRLAQKSIAEIGFPEGAAFQQIQGGIERKLCPAKVAGEVALKLRLWYKEQPNGETLFLAMEPIGDFSGKPQIFCIKCDAGQRWLTIENADPERIFLPSDIFILFR
ncbi:hypothetical protein KKF32_02775 [Patescibacteria group bacterium]|nr:hypothetical protein [Patescibacteria group bacterium]